MIRITKPATIPRKLSGDGIDENTRNCTAYDADPAFYNNNETSKFNIRKTIYNHRSVKNALLAAQHRKCCFCEKNQRDEAGAIEHFRPKSGYKSRRSEKVLIKPGYYWLGYTWSNLYFVCGTCNSSFKGNLFPLASENNRAKNHHDEISLESPFLLDPGGTEDPRHHIVFDDALPRGLTIIGRETISICGLDRSDLNEERNDIVAFADFRTGWN